VVVASTDNLLEGVLEGCSSDEESIDVWLGDELISVLFGDGSTVEDTGLLASLS